MHGMLQQQFPAVAIRRRMLLPTQHPVITSMITILLLGLFLSVCSNDHFPGGLRLAGTGMSPFWILLKQDDEGGGGWQLQL